LTNESHTCDLKNTAILRASAILVLHALLNAIFAHRPCCLATSSALLRSHADSNPNTTTLSLPLFPSVTISTRFACLKIPNKSIANTLAFSGNPTTANRCSLVRRRPCCFISRSFSLSLYAVAACLLRPVKPASPHIWAARPKGQPDLLQTGSHPAGILLAASPSCRQHPTRDCLLCAILQSNRASKIPQVKITALGSSNPIKIPDASSSLASEASREFC